MPVPAARHCIDREHYLANRAGALINDVFRDQPIPACPSRTSRMRALPPKRESDLRYRGNDRRSEQKAKLSDTGEACPQHLTGLIVNLDRVDPTLCWFADEPDTTATWALAQHGHCQPLTVRFTSRRASPLDGLCLGQTGLRPRSIDKPFPKPAVQAQDLQRTSRVGGEAGTK